MLCEYCKNNFENDVILKNHQKLAKYCIKLRNEKTPTFECKYCNNSFPSRYIMKKHHEDCINFPKNISLKFLTETQAQEIQNQKVIISALEAEIEKLKKQIPKEKPLKKTIKFTYGLNDTLDLSSERIQSIIDKNLIEEKHLDDGINGIMGFICKYIINPEIEGEGGVKIKKINYVCTDASRYQFRYINKNGNMCKDIYAVELMKSIREKIGKKCDVFLKTQENILDRHIKFYSIWYKDVFSKELIKYL